MPKAFAAKFSDLSGPTNPRGIWSPRYLRLKLSLDQGDKPDNVLQALYDWLGERGITPAVVDNILDLPSAEHAYDALIQLISGSPNARTGSGINGSTLPEAVKQTVQRTIKLIAQNSNDKQTRQMAAAASNVQQTRSKFGLESAQRVVRSMLDS